MPPKTTICSVCKQEVTKASTLEIRPGIRACRVHDGVTDQADARLYEAKEAERKRAADAEHKRRPGVFGHEGFENSDFLKEQREFQEWSQTHCWTCGTEGISMQDYLYKSLIAMKALEISGKFNFMTFQKDAFEVMGRPTVISQVPFLAHTDRHILRNVVKDRIKEILPLLGFMRICGKCAARYNIQDRIEATLPHPTMEQIENIMPVVAMMDPTLTILASGLAGR